MRMRKMMRINNDSISKTNNDAETIFEDFFNLSPDLLCISGFDGYFIKINPAVCKLLEYTEEELLAKPINSFVFQDDKNSTTNARNSIKDQNHLINFENRYITKSGRTVWLLWTSIPVENKQHIFAIAKNITYKKQLEDERNQHLAKLNHSVEEYKQLTYAAAHDLRSPVNNLISIFDLLEIDKVIDTESIEYLNITKDIINGLKNSLNDYITVLNDKIQNSSPVEEISFQESLDEVLFSISSFISNSDTTINVDFSVLSQIVFNKTYLKSIFLNLITNSIKYAKVGMFPVISIYTQIHEGKKQLIISDNGIGFDMENVENKIFGLHQKFNNNSDSNGIGLYLVYNHITNLGGQIAVDSELDNGATFTITFRD
ncbi:PAS domain-containing sensor histidine kinase [Flavobacterium algicola]|uniref:PAS domain-containing sensor histidine kinase n=1 Tax=Flavobacterium algicola TaxID=556529 RepID=UPI001EFC75E2|nr:PAS domain-containing sensor histidine kinase [Flavobacterium algicola]MCG9793607.1 PAS domain-containing sensor histidine kinase [Flavobacterium algicola]